MYNYYSILLFKYVMSISSIGMQAYDYIHILECELVIMQT